ncbi:hypothetical protein CGLAUT_08895 [Corynebacterium glaucum]|nr:hypothetical protein CGLAUT_08895 [Corynebacterium glaucum]
MMFAPVVEMPASSRSVIFRISEALKPPAAAAKPTIVPTRGERPTAWKAIAPSGTMMTKIASEAMEPVTPASATMKVSIRGLTLATIARIIAESRPECSATATPSITVRITPSGGNAMKFCTASVTILEMYSPVRRFSTWTVSPLPGLVACIPMRLPIQEEATVMMPRMTKSQNGSGSLLPTFSIQPSTPLWVPSFFCFLSLRFLSSRFASLRFASLRLVSLPRPFWASSAVTLVEPVIGAHFPLRGTAR